MIRLLVVLFCLYTTTTLTAREWMFELNPSQIKMCSSRKLERPKYFIEKCGIKNMVNLSFFTSRTFIPPYKDSTTLNLNNPKRWPLFTIESDGFPFIYDRNDLVNFNLESIKNDTKFIASGFPVLLRNGEKTKIQKSFFSKRRCPRTAIGIHPNGSIIVYVTTSASLKQLQNYFLQLGCSDAINLDGGSSTFLYLDGKKVYSSNQGRSYPNVLYWE